MRGAILGLHEGRGVIATADQRRLEFPLTEWRSVEPPMTGVEVDFVEENGEARAVYRVPAGVAGVSAPSQDLTQGAGLLGVISLCCLALGFFIPFVPTIAALILGAVGAGQAKREGDSNALLLNRIGWIGALAMLLCGLAFMALFGVFFMNIFALLFEAAGVHWRDLGPIADTISL